MNEEVITPSQTQLIIKYRGLFDYYKNWHISYKEYTDKVKKVSNVVII